MATTNTLAGDVKDAALAAKGKLRIEWADQWTPVLQLIRKRFTKERPLEGVRISACFARDDGDGKPRNYLARRRRRCGRCASCPLSTQDDVVASLVKDCRSPPTRLRAKTRKRIILTSSPPSTTSPEITMDDGADLVTDDLDEAPGVGLPA